MDLSTHLIDADGKIDRNGPECLRIASEAGTTGYYLCMLARGHKTPSLALAQRIQRFTNGAVSVNDWPQQEKAA